MGREPQTTATIQHGRRGSSCKTRGLEGARRLRSPQQRCGARGCVGKAQEQQAAGREQRLSCFQTPRALQAVLEDGHGLHSPTCTPQTATKVPSSAPLPGQGNGANAFSLASYSAAACSYTDTRRQGLSRKDAECLLLVTLTGLTSAKQAVALSHRHGI